MKVEEQAEESSSAYGGSDGGEGRASDPVWESRRRRSVASGRMGSRTLRGGRWTQYTDEATQSTFWYNEYSGVSQVGG